MNNGERIARLEEKMDGANRRLDNVDRRFDTTDRKIDELPERLKELFDERYASKKAVESIQETVAPLTNFRKKLWGLAVLAVFTVGITADIAWNFIKAKVGLG